MNYVEWLRVRNTVRVVAIVLGALLVLGVVSRVWLGVEYGFDQATGTVSHAAASPGTNHQLQGRILITTTTGPTVKTPGVGSIGTVDMQLLLSFAYVAALVIATALGASFSRENDHLEFAALKPVSRERFALGTIGADITGIFLAEALTAIAALLGTLLYGGTHFDVHGVTAAFLGLILVMPVAWYLFLNAATASLKRGAGMVVGFAWPVSVIVIALGQAHLGTGPLGLSVHTIFWTISRILPLTYASISSAVSDQTVGLGGGGDVLVAFILVLVYGALTMVQWRRVEA
jgi:hypothetical protein